MDSSEDEAKQPAENTELLDWFAGQALAGICAAEDTRMPKSGENVEAYKERVSAEDAAYCYRRARAMLHIVN